MTLFHWDTPQALEDLGGWPSRATAEAFAEYAEAVARRLGDRVRYWITHNEPWVHAWIGHSWGVHAPGRTSEADAVAAAHHLMLSHGWAVDVIRAVAPDAQVGITLNLAQAYPTSDSPEDEAAAWRVDGEGNRWFLDPIFRGSYPADLLERNELVAPFVQDGDLETISAPLDFLGVNNYFRFLVSAGDDGPRMERHSENQHTDMGWEVYPDALRELLVRVAKDYGPQAIYVTENGAAFGDIRGHDGRVHDPERTAYIAVLHRRGLTRGRRGRAREGVLRLEPARQLRVVVRLLEAVRDRLHRLPDARARPEGQLQLVPRLHLDESTHAAALADSDGLT